VLCSSCRGGKQEERPEGGARRFRKEREELGPMHQPPAFFQSSVEVKGPAGGRKERPCLHDSRSFCVSVVLFPPFAILATRHVVDFSLNLLCMKCACTCVVLEGRSEWICLRHGVSSSCAACKVHAS